MHKLNTSQYIFEDLINWKRNLMKTTFVHLEGHEVVSHRFVEIV